MSYIKIGKYGGSDPNADTYQFKEVLDVDYVDSTDVFMWFEAQNYSDKDFLYCRQNAMIYIANIGGFSALTNPIHKELAVQHFCVSKEDRDTLYNDDEQEVFWFDFVINSEACRTYRWDRAKSFTSFRMSIMDSNYLAEETTYLNTLYIKYGIDSFAKDNTDGLLDWLNGDAGYVDTGFPSKSYFTSELQGGIINILEGNY